MKQIKTLALAIAAAAIFMAGCDKDNTPKPTPLVSFAPKLNVATLFDISPNNGADGKYLSFRPAISQDMIVTVSAKGKINAVNKTTGAQLWQVSLKQPVSSSATIAGGRVFVGTLDGWVYALDAQSGKLIWQSNVPSEVLAAPASNGDVLVVHTHDGSVTALSADRGEQVWQTNVQTPKLSLEGDSAPVISGNNVIVGFDSGELIAYALDSGKMLWQRPIAIPTGASEVSQMVDVLGTPVIKDGVIYASSYHGNLVAVSAVNGDLIWQQPLSSFRSVAVSGDAVVATDAKGQVKAFSRDTGQLLWTQSAFKWRHTSAPQVVGKYAVVGDYQGYLHWLDVSSGRQLAVSRFGGKPIKSQPVVEAGRLYLTTSHGELVALQPKV